MLHPNVEVNCPEIWVPGQLTEKLKRKLSHHIWFTIIYIIILSWVILIKILYIQSEFHKQLRNL